MLRKIRICLAVLFLTGITLLVLDFTGVLHHYLAWMAKVQLLPALLALNVTVVAVLTLLTLLLGRVYCSVVCPLGVYQDVAAWLWLRLFHNGRKRYSHVKHPALHNGVRAAIFVVFVVLTAAGLTGLASLIAPYSSFIRMTQTLAQPAYIAANNILAWMAERADSYAFYSVEVWTRSVATLTVTLITWGFITTLAARWGRIYCNSICPIGSLLGVVARFSLYKPRVDNDKCIGCGLCERNCKAQAIKVTRGKGTQIDYTRCIDCFNCLEVCKHGALKYKAYKKENEKRRNGETKNDSGMMPFDKSRRTFLLASLSAVAGGALAQAGKKVDGGFATLKEKVIPERQTPILPPGAQSARHFAIHCTACQLCVSECPNNVLRPSADLAHFMQPVMSYERGYCREECHRCSDVCPTGALRLADSAEKVSTKVGQAHWVKKNCIPVTDGVECGNCARHCPTGAIEMIPLDEEDELSPYVPMVNEARCIGCGACENLCPSRPLPAIIVEGVEEQRRV